MTVLARLGPREAPGLRLVLVLASLVLAGALAPAAAAVCVPSCDVGSVDKVAFAPPATLVESGSTVVWRSDGLKHTATDATAASPCFHVAYTDVPRNVTFTVADGRLVATTDGRARVCAGATELPDGSFSVAYSCLDHPAMKATLVVK